MLITNLNNKADLTTSISYVDYNPIDVLGNMMTKTQLQKLLDERCESEVAITDVNTQCTIKFDVYDLIDSMVDTHWQYADHMPEIYDWIDAQYEGTPYDHYDVIRMNMEEFMDQHESEVLEECDIEEMMGWALDDYFYEYECATLLGDYESEVAEKCLELELLEPYEIEVLTKYEDCLDMDALGEQIIRENDNILKIGEYYYLIEY